MSLNRRELIAALLGAPAVLAGCSSSSTLPLEGELFGQSFEIGHRLRDGFRPQPEANQWKNVDVLVVGGGAAGLSAAWKLSKSGCDDFVVLELEPAPGGTSRSGKCELSSYPWGAHYLPVPFAENQPLIELLSEMGVVESIAAEGTPVIKEQFLCRDPDERLYFQGEWIEGLYPATDASPEDLEQLAAFRKEIDRWTDWRDPEGRRAFVIPTSLAASSPEITELDRQSMTDWLLQHGWTSPRLHWVVDYSCRDDYGLSAEQTSAWAGVLYFAARQKAAGSEHQPLMTWPAGNGHIINHLAGRVGARLKTSAAVTEIRRDGSDGHRHVEVVWLDTQTQQPAGYRARQVIFAAPQFLAHRLIAGFSQRAQRRVDQFEYGSWLVANLHLRDRPRETSFPLSWDNVIHDSRSLGYVVATHQSGRDHGPTVLTWYYPYCGHEASEIREKLQRATWSELADVVMADLQRPHPDIRRLTKRLDIFRWGHAMIRPRPGFWSSPQRREAARRDGPIHFANTDLSGIALFEEAFDHGCRAADDVLKALS